MIDELGFYLHCRYLLFRGPELNLKQAKNMATHYIQYNRVIEVIEQILTGLPNNNLSELVEMIQDKSKEKGGIKVIECSLALRIMLEYYKNEKALKYTAILEIFNKIRNDGKDCTSFANFQIICQSLSPNVTDYTTIKMYRDCWSLSNGKITADTFFLISNESTFFYDLLTLKVH